MTCCRCPTIASAIIRPLRPGRRLRLHVQEIGRIFSVTRERVRQIESEAIRKLQHPGPTKKLSGFLEG